MTEILTETLGAEERESRRPGIGDRFAINMLVPTLEASAVHLVIGWRPPRS